jgi:hypothetical protein
MPEHESECELPRATGLPGRMPRNVYCTHQCYNAGKRSRAESCTCKGCGGKAHGRGWNYAFEHGYLSALDVVFRPTPADQEWLPFTPTEAATQADHAV